MPAGTIDVVASAGGASIVAVTRRAAIPARASRSLGILSSLTLLSWEIMR
jgi:hypothetical protein